MKTSLISKIASIIDARQNCLQSGNTEWFENHTEYLEKIEQKYLPHGSGIDCGCKINLELSNENRIVITFDYHCMNEDGYYDDWQSYKLIAKPSFQGIDLRITGKERQRYQLKDYLYDTFYYCLNEIIDFEPVK